MKDFKTVLFATDFSESSDHAFEYAFSMAKCFNSRLLILHIINELVDDSTKDTLMKNIELIKNVGKKLEFSKEICKLLLIDNPYSNFKDINFTNILNAYNYIKTALNKKGENK